MKKNIIFICTDQQRFDSLGCSGNPYARTPNIDRIASQGVRFTNHNTPCPICSPSRSTMLTGLYPRNHGLAVNGMALDPKLPTLPSRLADAGYRTHGVGKHHLQPILAPLEYDMPESSAFWGRSDAKEWNGPYFGFQSVDFVIGEADHAATGGGHYAQWLNDHHPEALSLLTREKALEPPPSDLNEIWKCAIPAELHYNTWITNQATEFISDVDTQDEPFFLFVSYPDPHHPFSPPRPYCDLFSPEEVPLPQVEPDELNRMPDYYNDILCPSGDEFMQAYWGASEDAEQGFLLRTEKFSEESIRLAIAHTYGMVNMIDDGVGQIIEALRNQGIEDDTIIVFTSDHGELLGDHGLIHKGPPAYRQVREVPFIIKGPGIPEGKVETSLTSHEDIMPTLLDLAGVESQEQRFDGISLKPMLDGQEDCQHEVLFGEYHPRSKTGQLYNQTIQTDHWRLTLYPEEPGWGELFDRDKDPGEHCNLFYDSTYSDTTQNLKELLNRKFPPCPIVRNERIAKW